VGVALIAGVPFSVMGYYHVISFHADISHLNMLMSLTFVVSFLYGTIAGFLRRKSNRPLIYKFS
jgi:hypothetical protein